MRKAIGGLIILGASLMACAPPVETKIGKPLCVGNVIVAGEYAEVSCNVQPPQRLDLEMNVSENSEGTPMQRCLDYGGVFIPRQSEGGEDICQGVDY